MRTDLYLYIESPPPDDPYKHTVVLVDEEREDLGVRDFQVDSPESWQGMVSWATEEASKLETGVVIAGFCLHCQEPMGMDYYMVTDQVWISAGVPEKAELHLTCLETRLGRRLTIEDFTDVPVNQMIRFGWEMAQLRG